MSDSEDEMETKHWEPFSERPEWSDVQPLPQNDGPNPPVSIAYSDRFRETMDYLRAVINSGEKSERVLELCAEAVHQNPANYVAWWYRRQTLLELKKDPAVELEWMLNDLLETPKNYQMWHHRRELIMITGTSNNEKEIIDKVLKMDSKNYHAWCHRRWFVQTFKCWENELEWVDKLIQDDVRNNSAWNYRFFLFEVFVLKSKEAMSSIQSEIQYAYDAIIKAPHNESPYSYLIGVVCSCDNHLLSSINIALPLMSGFVQSHPTCPYPLSTIIHFHDKWAKIATKDKQHELLKSNSELSSKLSSIDKIRVKYWSHQEAHYRNCAARTIKD